MLTFSKICNVSTQLYVELSHNTKNVTMFEVKLFGYVYRKGYSPCREQNPI